VYARDAQYEAQQRTVAVSAKPAVGKELLSRADFPEVANVQSSFKGQFETERFIFGKIRDFTLRSIAHLNSSSNHVAGGNSTHHSDIVQYRMMAENISRAQLKGLDILHIPKGIRDNVIAKLLHDNGVEFKRPAGVHIGIASTTSNVHHSSFGALNTIFAHPTSNNLVDQTGNSSFYRAFDKLHLSLDGSVGEVGEKMAFTPNQLLKCFVAMISLALASSESDRSSSKSHLRIVFADLMESQVQAGKYGLASSDADTKGNSRIHNETKKECGFGTAPIWYQQSMATGPPT
jgi:hypothetical protein